jgi:hypothetical protein
MKTGKPVVLREGDNLDVTAPIVDKAGKPIAATGITLRCAPGADEDVLTKEAAAVARELTTAIQAAEHTLW